MRNLKLGKDTEITIVIQETVSTTTDNVYIQSVIDDFEKVTATIFANGQAKILILWENEEYAKIGNWTDEDVDKRIIEMLNNNK